MTSCAVACAHRVAAAAAVRARRAPVKPLRSPAITCTAVSHHRIATACCLYKHAERTRASRSTPSACMLKNSKMPKMHSIGNASVDRATATSLNENSIKAAASQKSVNAADQVQVTVVRRAGQQEGGLGAGCLLRLQQRLSRPPPCPPAGTAGPR